MSKQKSYGRTWYFWSAFSTTTVSNFLSQAKNDRDDTNGNLYFSSPLQSLKACCIYSWNSSK